MLLEARVMAVVQVRMLHPLAPFNTPMLRRARSGPLVVLGGFEGLQRGAAPFAPALLHGLLTGSARRLRRVTAKLRGGLSAEQTENQKIA